VEQIAETISHFHLEFLQFPGKNVIGDVVVREERRTLLVETFADHIGNLGVSDAELTTAIAERCM
jgi:hypothetical protein